MDPAGSVLPQAPVTPHTRMTDPLPVGAAQFLALSHKYSSVRKDSSIIRSSSCSAGMPAKFRIMSSLA
jgi:hypothetical protein